MGAWSWLWSHLHRVYLGNSKKPISMAYCPATDPIRSDPSRLDLLFRFVSFPFLTLSLPSSFAPLQFDLIARRARARATCGSYSSATSAAAQADAPTTYKRTHTRAYMQHATVGTPQKHLACCELSTLCCWVVPQRNNY